MAKPLGWCFRIKPYRRINHERGQMPIDVTVEEPRARVVSEEADRDIITRIAHAHDVADNEVIKFV